MSAARLRLIECRAILGGERDKLRVVWDEQATNKDRRLLLAMAGRIGSVISLRAGLAWCDLPAVDRMDIGAALKKWREWSERVA